jgi:WD40 repeat protein
LSKPLPRPRALAKLALAVTILGALAGVVQGLRPPPPTPARLTFRDSADYLLAGFAPDGRTVAGVSYRVEAQGSHWAGPLRLWDAVTGELRATLAPDLAFCWPPLRFSPDSRFLAIEGPGVLKLWDTATGAEKATVALSGNRFGQGNFEFAPDGRTLAVGSRGAGAVKLYDPATGQERAVLDGALPPLQFAPDGSSLATATARGVRLWDVATGREKATLRGAPCRPRSLAFAADGRTLAAATVRSDDADEGAPVTVRVWDVASAAETATLPAPNKGYWLSFSQDGTLLLVWDFNLTPAGWDLTALPPRPLAPLPTGCSWQLAPDGKTLVGRTYDAVVVWDVAAGQERAAFAAPTARGLNPVSISPDARSLFVQTSSGEGPGGLAGILGFLVGPAPPSDADTITDAARVLDATTGRTRAILDDAGYGQFAPDGTGFVAGGSDRALHLWDVRPPGWNTTLVWSLGALGLASAVSVAWAGLWSLRGRRAEPEEATAA